MFSYLWEQLVPFTRNYESIKSALNNVEEYNKTCVEAALTGVSSVVTEEWNSVTPSQVRNCLSVYTRVSSVVTEEWNSVTPSQVRNYLSVHIHYT